VPSRKKQTPEAGAPLATGRKKTIRVPKSRSQTAVPARKRRSPTPAAENGGGRGKHDLVIVESPAKAKTINKYLGPNFKVLASYGHVRDLPRRRRRGELVAGINIEGGWVPTYVVEERDEARGSGKRRSPKDILAELKREAAKANRILLATDPDREGEAIAWHIEDELHLDEERTFRITFNEITRSAVQNALAQPGKIDMDRVKAQEARRILDRVVGYPLSNLLSKKVARRSSAGRVQSVALRLVVDREREIEAFRPTEFWKITALLSPRGTVSIAPRPLAIVQAKEASGGRQPPVEETDKQGANAPRSPEVPPGSFQAELAEWAGKKFEAADEATGTAIARALDTANYVVSGVEQKDRTEKAPPPFTTSTLQQQANIRLRFTADRTMRAAQRLYEGVDLGSEGSVALITYMRTDSTRVSNEALQAVRGHIQETFGPPYLPAEPNKFTSGKSAQEAHEAIRPTDLAYTPERVGRLGLAGDQLRVYTLIYQRFVASQMMPAVFAVTNIEVLATPTRPELIPAQLDRLGSRSAGGSATGEGEPGASATGGVVGLFKAQGKVLKFDGYRKVLAPAGRQEDATLPAVQPRQELDRLGLTASQHFTQPPPRYNEASLIKALEKEGIGRPSTYASIIHKITSEERGYIEVRERRFHATEIGKVVTDLLVKHFPNIMDLKFTSHMEEDLDKIETQQMEYHDVLNEFWEPFSRELKAAEEAMPGRGVETGETCPLCGKPLVRNYSKKTRREFVGCSGWKEGCKYVKPAEGEAPRPEPVETEYKCPVCNKPMLQRMGRSGPFLGCSGYPECKTTMNFGPDGQPVLSAKPTEHTCEKCGKPMVVRQGRRGPFLACTGYPKCKNAKDVDAEGNPVQPIEVGIACEKCGAPMIVKRGPRGPFLGCSAYPKCRSTKPVPEDMREQIKAKMPAPAKKAVPAVEVHETCPECGAPMKLRPGRRGYFLGCSKYPKCKGTREASAELLEQLQEAGAPS
jgi:DNA topoisomerase-1